MKGPKFLIYWRPLLDVLKEMGGVGASQEVIEKVIEKMKIPEKEVEEYLPSGQSRVRNRIRFARMYLTKAGLMDSSTWGIWRLTDKGLASTLSDSDVEQLFKVVRSVYQQEAGKSPKGIESQVLQEEIATEDGDASELLKILQSLSASGKRLLTECGFKNVEVTGKSGDGGIDGIGLLEINDLVSLKVLFQCKRYKESVGPGMVRDFRGAMQGRAEKGIIITTGYFAKGATTEANRDGVPPIELVDGDKLVEMFEKYRLGLKPKTVYDIDLSFFEEFK
jgi:restriction system protein